MQQYVSLLNITSTTRQMDSSSVDQLNYMLNLHQFNTMKSTIHHKQQKLQQLLSNYHRAS